MREFPKRRDLAREAISRGGLSHHVGGQDLERSDAAIVRHRSKHGGEPPDMDQTVETPGFNLCARSERDWRFLPGLHDLEKSYRILSRLAKLLRSTRAWKSALSRLAGPWFLLSRVALNDPNLQQ
jgi:hypothetical protein